MARPILSQTPPPAPVGKIAQVVMGRGRVANLGLLAPCLCFSIRNEQVALGESCFLQFWLLRNAACWNGGHALYKTIQKEATAGLAKGHKTR